MAGAAGTAAMSVNHSRMVCGLVSAASGVNRQASTSRTTKIPIAMILAKRRTRRAGGRSPTKDLGEIPAPRSAVRDRRVLRAATDLAGRRCVEARWVSGCGRFASSELHRLDQRAGLRRRRRELAPRSRRRNAPIRRSRTRTMCGDDRRVLASKARSHSVSTPNERLFRLAEPTRSMRSSTTITLEWTMVSMLRPFSDTFGIEPGSAVAHACCPRRPA